MTPEAPSRGHRRYRREDLEHGQEAIPGESAGQLDFVERARRRAVEKLVYLADNGIQTGASPAVVFHRRC